MTSGESRHGFEFARIGLIIGGRRPHVSSVLHMHACAARCWLTWRGVPTFITLGSITLRRRLQDKQFSLSKRPSLLMAGPLPERSTQILGLIVQLPDPFRLKSKIAADFRDLSFESLRQFVESRPRASA